MATATRVMIVGRTPTRRRLREEMEAGGFVVAAEVAGPAEVASDESIDVVLVADDRLVDQLLDAWGEAGGPPLVVLTRDPRVARELAGLGLRGWATVPPDRPEVEVAAAVTAATNGFAVTPATSESAQEDDEEHGPVEPLTARERDVLELVSQGLTNRAIALRLGVSDQTVKFHLSSIFGKLGVSTRTEAVRRGVRAGLITF